MKKKVVSILYGLFCCLVPGLKPILDGRVTPIYLETRYTFTNFEWAKGRVFFRRGFDLPIGGTAILDVVEPVENGITFSNSTLMMQGNLDLAFGSTITGMGYISCNNNRLLFESDQFFHTSDTQFIFLSPGTIEGTGVNVLSFQQGALIFTGGSNPFTLRKFFMRAPNADSFVTGPNSPLFLTFDQVVILVARDLELKSNFINVAGLLDLRGLSRRTVTIEQQLRFNTFGRLLVSPQMELFCREVGAASDAAEVVLNNAKLSYTFTGTSQQLFIPIFPGFSGRGRILIQGQCELEAPQGSELLLSNESLLQIESGARLSVNPGITLKVL